MPKKVLFVATVVKTHIMQFHVPYLKMFQDMGWETAVAAKNDYENPADCVIPFCDVYYDIPFQRIPWKKGNLRAYKMLKAIIEEGSYDIIHCHTPVGSIIARFAAIDARKRGTKVIYTAHGFHFFSGAPIRNWLLYFPMEWLCAFFTDVLITINREDYSRAKHLMHPKRLEYVPGVGIDTEKFCHSAENRLEKRRELGFGDDAFLMLTVAEMTKNKNHITVLRAMEGLKSAPEFEKLHYLIVGRGEEWEHLKEAAQAMGIENHVHFLGYRTDVPELYGSADLFVFVPFREGLSVALMEAMGSGLPILCTKIRGNTDLIEDNVSGKFVENNPKALSAAIGSLWHDGEKREALGREAQRKIQDFSAENVHKRMKDIYLSL